MKTLPLLLALPLSPRCCSAPAHLHTRARARAHARARTHTHTHSFTPVPAASEGLAVLWEGGTWSQWNGGTCTAIAAGPDGTAYITDDCRTVYRSGGAAASLRGIRAGVVFVYWIGSQAGELSKATRLLFPLLYFIIQKYPLPTLSTSLCSLGALAAPVGCQPRP